MAQVTSPIILDSTGQQIHSDLQQIKTVLTTPSAAEDITFDNTGTGMQADDVQDAITELKSNLIKLAVLRSSISCAYQDTANSIGYRTTETTKVLVTSLEGYPTDKTILANIIQCEDADGGYSFTIYIDRDNYIRATSKISSTVRFKLFVLYTD